MQIQEIIGLLRQFRPSDLYFKPYFEVLVNEMGADLETDWISLETNNIPLFFRFPSLGGQSYSISLLVRGCKYLVE